MPSLIVTKLAPVDPDAIACAMLAIQLLEGGGVASKFLNRGSG